MKTISTVRTGSHLYGLNTQESDLDCKGVYLPDKENLFCGMATHHNLLNSPGVDFETFSIQTFMGQISKAQPMALEMLFAPVNMLIDTSEEWADLVSIRGQLLHKECSSFVGYCRSQASKYCIKGDRLNVLQECIKFFKSLEPDDYWYDYFKLRMDGVGHIQYNNELKFITILGKKFYENTPIDEILKSLVTTESRYGGRVRSNLDRKDWKALSHAVRIALEVEELLLDGFITLPLKHKDYVLKIKKGEYGIEKVETDLDSLLNRVESAKQKSKLPEKFNMELAKQYLVGLYK